MNARANIHPADQAVITQALLAAANEMGAKLIRSAHSPIVREASDCSTALLDRFGNVVAQPSSYHCNSGRLATHLHRARNTFR